MRRRHHHLGSGVLEADQGMKDPAKLRKARTRRRGERRYEKGMQHVKDGVLPLDKIEGTEKAEAEKADDA